MIDEKKLIEVIRNLKKHYDFFYKEGRSEIDDTVKGACDTLFNDIAEIICKQPKVGEWISCSERLPDELVAVNVTWVNRCPENYYMHIKDKPFTDTAILHDGEWRWWDSTIIDYLKEYGGCIGEIIDESIDILAWQPLPEPYKEG